MSNKATIELLQAIKSLCEQALERYQPEGVNPSTARKGTKRFTKAEKDKLITKFRAKMMRRGLTKTTASK